MSLLARRLVEVDEYLGLHPFIWLAFAAGVCGWYYGVTWENRWKDVDDARVRKGKFVGGLLMAASFMAFIAEMVARRLMH